MSEDTDAKAGGRRRRTTRAGRRRPARAAADGAEPSASESWSPAWSSDPDTLPGDLVEEIEGEPEAAAEADEAAVPATDAEWPAAPAENAALEADDEDRRPTGELAITPFTLAQLQEEEKTNPRIRVGDLASDHPATLEPISPDRPVATIWSRPSTRSSVDDPSTVAVRPAVIITPARVISDRPPPLRSARAFGNAPSADGEPVPPAARLPPQVKASAAWPASAVPSSDASEAATSWADERTGAEPPAPGPELPAELEHAAPLASMPTAADAWVEPAAAPPDSQAVAPVEPITAPMAPLATASSPALGAPIATSPATPAAVEFVTAPPGAGPAAHAAAVKAARAAEARAEENAASAPAVAPVAAAPAEAAPAPEPAPAAPSAAHAEQTSFEPFDAITDRPPPDAAADEAGLQLVDVDVAEVEQQRRSRTPPPPPPDARAKAAPPKRPPPPPAQSAQHRPEDEQKKRKQVRQWWERFFSDDYLMSVRPAAAAQIAKQVDFVEQSLGVSKGGTILDVGCGLGLHAVELTRRGYLVVGLDLSLAMITRAAELAQQQQLKLNVVHADIREMEFDGAFDGVICMGTTFGFFDDDANRDVLARLHQALRPGGRVLLDMVNRDYVVRFQPNLVWFEGDDCVCMEESDFNYFNSRLTVKRTMMREDGKQSNAEYSVRLYSLHELGLMMQQVGFRVIEVSGQEAVRGAFFGVNSPRMLLLAERRAAATRPSAIITQERGGSTDQGRPPAAVPSERGSAELAKINKPD